MLRQVQEVPREGAGVQRAHLEPAGVRADELAHLCADMTANGELVKNLLWEIADLVAGRIHGMPREDAQLAIYEAMIRAMPKYNPTRRGAFPYFWTVGLRAGWHAAEKWQREPAVTRKAAVGETMCGIPVGSSNVSTIRAAQPARHGCRPRSARPAAPTPRHLIDRIIRNARKAMRGCDRATAEHAGTEIGIRLLQTFRYELVGEYLPLRTPAMRYSRSHAVAQQD